MKYDTDVHELNLAKIDALVEQQRLVDSIANLNKTINDIEQRYRLELDEKNRYVENDDE